MQRNYLLGAVSASLVIALAACGGDSGGGPSFSDSVSTADAQDFASDAASDAGVAMSELNFGGGAIGLVAPALAARYASRNLMPAPSLGGHTLSRNVQFPDWRAVAANPAGFRAAAAEGCTVTESGQQQGGGYVDVDQNNFPDNLYIKEECLTTDSTSNVDTTYTHYFLVEERLKQNFASLYGFDLSVNYLEKYADQFGNFELESQGGTESLDIRSGSASHSMAIVEREGEKFDTASEAFEFGANWNAGFTPAGTITVGDPLPNGALTFAGREYVTDNHGTNLSFGISTDTPLAFSAACQASNTLPPFTAGVLIGHLNNNASSANFSATFTACGVAPTISTNGTHDPSAVAARK